MKKIRTFLIFMAIFSSSYSIFAQDFFGGFDDFGGGGGGFDDFGGGGFDDFGGGGGGTAEEEKPAEETVLDIGFFLGVGAYHFLSNEKGFQGSGIGASFASLSVIFGFAPVKGIGSSDNFEIGVAFVSEGVIADSKTMTSTPTVSYYDTLMFEGFRIYARYYRKIFFSPSTYFSLYLGPSFHLGQSFSGVVTKDGSVVPNPPARQEGSSSRLGVAQSDLLDTSKTIFAADVGIRFGMAGFAVDIGTNVDLNLSLRTSIVLSYDFGNLFGTSAAPQIQAINAAAAAESGESGGGDAGGGGFDDFGGFGDFGGGF